MKAALLFFLIGGLYGYWVSFAYYRSSLRRQKEDRDYWFKEYAQLSKDTARRLDLREHDDADWWK